MLTTRLALALVLTAAPTGLLAYQAQTDPYPSLSHAEESAMTKAAISGSGSDAYHLAMYYGFTKSDGEAELRWAIIGAENGDAKSQWLAFCLLEKVIDGEDRARARFWLKRSAAQGFGPAKKVVAAGDAEDPATIPTVLGR